MATIVDGKNRIPFMRGMLVHYLIQRGFSYPEARSIANEVRELLGKQDEVLKKDMVHFVDQVIQEVRGERVVGDLVFWERQVTNITVERKDGNRPFSKGFMAHSLEATGLAPDEAYAIASAIEGSLLDQRREEIGHRELEKIIAELLAERHDPSYADRYKVWRAWGDLDTPLIILIGGSSGAGKTTLAITLANLLDIPRVVATDDIRQMMRLTLTPDLMPTLHTSTYTAWKKVPDPSSEKDPVIAGYRDQARTICVGVHAIISRCLEENASVIIDGVHLLPDFLDLKGYGKSAFIVPLCIGITDPEDYGRRFGRRADQAPARPKHRYLAHLDEIFKIQDHIIECYSACGLPVISNTSSEGITSEAAMVVSEQLQDQDEIRAALGEEIKKKNKDS
jgi:2-phosphoglycerate kinase